VRGGAVRGGAVRGGDLEMFTRPVASAL